MIHRAIPADDSDPPMMNSNEGGFCVSGRDIFISYSREERTAARHFAESFEREGFSVWWDAVLRSGQTFDEVIEKELRAAKAAVVLWSPRSVASRWVRAEATLADRGNKLVPVIIERCDLPIIFELTHAADLSKWTGDTSDAAWQTLVSDLRRLVGEGEEAPSVPPVPAEEAAKPAPVAKAQPAPPSEDSSAAAGESAPVDPEMEELMLALARIGKKPRVPNLQQPTQQEEELTQFFHQADVRRMQEGDRYHCLQRLDDERPDARFVVSPTGITIGRSAPADIIITGSAVSRSHCRVELAGDKLRVTDLNSTNGTFIDDKRIERSELLPVGSILRVGNVLFEHEISERTEADEHADLVRFAQDYRARGARVAKS